MKNIVECVISIQALYDYKLDAEARKKVELDNFNSSIVRL